MPLILTIVLQRHLLMWKSPYLSLRLAMSDQLKAATRSSGMIRVVQWLLSRLKAKGL